MIPNLEQCFIPEDDRLGKNENFFIPQTAINEFVLPHFRSGGLSSTGARKEFKIKRQGVGILHGLYRRGAFKLLMNSDESWTNLESL